MVEAAGEGEGAAAVGGTEDGSDGIHNDHHQQLPQERDPPQTLPAEGTGRSVVEGSRGEVADPATRGVALAAPAAATRADTTRQHEKQLPPALRSNLSSYFADPPSSSAAATPDFATSPNLSAVLRETAAGHSLSSMATTATTAMTATTAGNTSSSISSSSWLPSPVIEGLPSGHDRHQNGALDPAGVSEASAAPGANGAGTPLEGDQSHPAILGVANSTTTDKDLAVVIDRLAGDGIQVVPSHRGRSDSAKAAGSATTTSESAIVPTTLLSSTLEVPQSTARASRMSPSPVRQSSFSSGIGSTAASVRPAPPEHKKSMFGKLFSHKDKEGGMAHARGLGGHAPEKTQTPPLGYLTSPTHASQHQSTGLTADDRSQSQSSSKSRDRGYSSTSNSTPYGSGAESDSSYPASGFTRDRSTSSAATSTATNGRDGKEAGGGSTLSNFLNGRRSSNKKMEKPDPTLLTLQNKSTHSSYTALETGPSPNASHSTLQTLASTLAPPQAPGIYSTPSSRGSMPDLNAVAGGTSANTSRPGSANRVRRPSEGQGDKPLSSPPDAHTPIGDGAQTVKVQSLKEKSLREHLANLGTVGKLNRKTSQTSRKSDDGKSEKSDYHRDDVPVSTTAGAVPASSTPGPPKRAPSVGGQSNASTSLLKKYGVCEKVAIGKGATAVVRLAHKWDRSTEKLYAVKEFRKRRKNETEKEYVKKLTSEFCISSTLHHINVVETVDLVQNEEKHWCEVMEYCPGGDLYAAIKKGDMPTDRMNSYFKQIVTGVAYLHSMGVAHRDIKPENLLLDGQGHVKITDFGVSDVFRMCWEKQTHMSKGLCGSEPYIAPEQFEQKEYDARLVDVWAVAVVYYCMQAQELPWRVAKLSDPSFQSYLQSYASSNSPPPLGNLHPKECRFIVKKMLDPNARSRIGMEAVLADTFLKSIDYTAKPVHPTPLM